MDTHKNRRRFALGGLEAIFMRSNAFDVRGDEFVYSCPRENAGVKIGNRRSNKKRYTKVRRATQYIVAPTTAYAAMPSKRLAPLVTRKTATTAMVPRIATTCSMRRS